MEGACASRLYATSFRDLQTDDSCRRLEDPSTLLHKIPLETILAVTHNVIHECHSSVAFFSESRNRRSRVMRQNV